MQDESSDSWCAGCVRELFNYVNVVLYWETSSPPPQNLEAVHIHYTEFTTIWSEVDRINLCFSQTKSAEILNMIGS